MTRHGEFLVRRTTSGAAILSLLLVVTSCTNYATASELAAHAVSQNARDVAERVALLAAGMETPVPLTAARLGEVTENVAISDSGEVVPFAPPGLEVGYASFADAHVLVVEALLRGNAQTHQGLGGSAAQLFACAEFRADFDSRTVTVEDTDCPAWLSDWTESSELVSVTDVSQGELDGVTW